MDKVTAVENEISVAQRALDVARQHCGGIREQVGEATAGLVEHIDGRIYLCGIEISPIAPNDPKLRTGSIVYMPDFNTVGDHGTAKRFVYVEQYHRSMVEDNMLSWTLEGANAMADALVKVAARVGRIR